MPLLVDRPKASSDFPNTTRGDINQEYLLYDIYIFDELLCPHAEVHIGCACTRGVNLELTKIPSVVRL